MLTRKGALARWGVLALLISGVPVAGWWVPARAQSGGSTATLEQRLAGTWLHSHEEDTDTEIVYRRDSYNFPPARGRRGYDFGADHTCNVIGISPRDGSARTSCTWRTRPGTPTTVVVTLPDGNEDVLSLATLEKDRLVVAKS